MKTNNKRTSKKPVLVGIISTIIVLIIGTCVFAYFKHRSDVSTASENKPSTTSTSGVVNYSAPTTQQQQAGATTKAQANDSTSNNTPLTVIITSTPGGSGSNKITKLSTLINTVTNTGTCTLTLNGPETEPPQQVAIQAGPSSSTCEGFDLSNLPSGSWKATLNVQVNSQSSSTTANFTVS